MKVKEKLLIILQKIIIYMNIKGFLNYLPDYFYLKLIYIGRKGKRLRLKEPITFNEKLQWLKLYDRNDKYTTMVDKYEVRDYIVEIIGEEYLVPILGVWDKFEEINFDELPNQFVLKCTHDSGGLIICKDKNSLDINWAREKINNCMNRNYYYNSREWPYKNVKPRIIAEVFIEDDIKDYKFYCFNGKPYYLYISQGLDDHNTARISFYDMELSKAPFGRSDYLPFEDKIIKPKNFDLMIELSIKLSKDLPFIRVDLYNVDNKIYFSELTFTPCSGFMPFDPPEYDDILGELIDLPNKII